MDIIGELTKELKEIDKALFQLSKRKRGTPEQLGSICARTVRGSSQYFYRAPGEEKSRYVSKGEAFKLKACAQADYDNRTEKDLIRQKKAIELFLKHYDKNGINATYYRLCAGRKELVTPLRKTDEMIIEEWFTKNPGNQNSFPKDICYRTERGDTVRSKSELIIADMLFRNNVPYQYEPKLFFADGRSVCPDFIALNVRKRKTVYWEHLGLLTEEDYAKRNFEKLNYYENNGVIIGDNLIITMETEAQPLDIAMIMKKIQLFLF